MEKEQMSGAGRERGRARHVLLRVFDVAQQADIRGGIRDIRGGGIRDIGGGIRDIRVRRRGCIGRRSSSSSCSSCASCCLGAGLTR